MLCAVCILSVFLLFTSCEPHTRTYKPFVWDEDVKTLVNGNIYSWLQKAPFENEFGKSDGEHTIITNADQIFPFKGRYYNAIEELREDVMEDTVIYRTAEVLYQDSLWGDLFLHATLLYEDQEVFLNQRYLQTGSVFFDGVEGATDLRRSTLYETGVFGKQERYKTGIYWATANFSPYLLGFYQQGQLVFEAAIPLMNRDTLATLQKLQEINTSLGLNIQEWEAADVAALQRMEDPKTFWEDPFEGIYPTYPVSNVFIKIKDTPFIQEDKASQGDYSFSYQSNGGTVALYTIMQKTDLSQEDFDKENKKMNMYRYGHTNIYYEEHPKAGRIEGIAKSYYLDNQYLEVHFTYPEGDLEARHQVHSVLRYVKILNFTL